MSAFLFGPLGSMRPVIASRGVSVLHGRGFSEFVSSGGVRHVQAGRSAPRTWTLGRLWKEPEWARLFGLAAHGLVGQCWIYDVAIARENMIPARLATDGEPVVLVNGLPMGGLIAGHEVTVPVLAGRVYTVAVWATGAPGSTAAQYKLGSGSYLNIVGPEGAGARQCAAAFTPAEDTAVTLRVPGAGVSGATVHEGAPRGDFYATSGTPCKVAVQDPQRVLQLVTDQHIKSDYEVTLLEVGRPTV